MSIEENKELGRELFARLSAGDVEGGLKLLSDDVVWWLAGKPELSPFAGTYTKERIAKLLYRMMGRLTNGLAMTVKTAVGEDNLVVLEIESHGELDNGRPYHNEYLILIRVADGMITEVREYNDTQHAHAVWIEP
ncbi:MAG: nuclear transport factor 2 family protein [Sporichthyaceae bacterium]|nr:nuclear transport factor 2 family protein [Sporichthyaceae bacterium]